MTLIGHSIDAVIRRQHEHAARPQDSPSSGFTPEHLRVLGLVARGRSDKAVAAQLSIDLRNVHEFLDAAYFDLGFGSDPDPDPDLDPRVMLALAYIEHSRADVEEVDSDDGGAES